MIAIRRSPAPLLGPDGPNDHLWIHEAAQDVPQGGVYVALTEDGTLRPQLEGGKRVVLQSAHDRKQKAELITCGGTAPIDSDAVMAAGIFLNGVDYAKFSNRNDSTLRLYTYRDTFRKMASADGMSLLVPALLALLIALVGIFFLMSSQGQPSASAAAGTAQAVLAWAGQPTDQLDAAQFRDDPQAATVHQQLDTRSRQAEWCLLGIEGQRAPAVTIPGVTCRPASVPVWGRALTGSLITGGIAALTALIGLFALRSRYGFQKSPAS